MNPDSKPKKPTCCICHKELKGYGNNAWPYKSGRCCDKCNWMFVIPMRYGMLANKKK